MTDTGSAPGLEREPWPEIDTTVPHVSRVYDYLLGGKANFAVDRKAAQRAYEAWPGGLDAVKTDVRAHRTLLGRVVRYAVVESGVRQFLDIGTGIPKQDNVHEVAQRVAPESRVVYVDNDPIVLAHAHRLLTSSPEGVTRYIYGDLREPGQVLDTAGEVLDFAQPVAVMLFGILHFFTPEDDPAGILGTLMKPLAPGSYLAITHLARDVHGDAMAETFRRLNERLNQTVVLRSKDEVAGLMSGLDLVDPGVVLLPEWRPDPGAEQPSPDRALPMWCAVGRKPGDPRRI